MKIICSADNSVMEHTDCLNCALMGFQPCGYDYSLLKALYGDDQKEDRRKEIHVTDLTGCLRKAFLDKTAPAAERPHEMITRWMGSAVHAYAEGSDDWLESELPIVAEGITGKADIVYRDGRVVDFKTTRWLYPDKLPYGSHALQVNIYAWLLSKMGRKISSLQIQYVDMSGPTKCRKCRVPVRMIGGELKCPTCLQPVKGAHLGAVLCDIPLMETAEIEQLVTSRRNKLDKAIASGNAPDREPGYLCVYCPHYAECQPDLVDE